jgi:hypothetical protein
MSTLLPSTPAITLISLFEHDIDHAELVSERVGVDGDEADRDRDRVNLAAERAGNDADLVAVEHMRATWAVGAGMMVAVEYHVGQELANLRAQARGVCSRRKRLIVSFVASIFAGERQSGARQVARGASRQRR